ncbi:MAG: hypothetical protein H7A47_10435 [Verrucomicrobiales bacterium]|nr:hypothetical protein [Verrucomicrobiales bacterium]
MNAVLKIVRNPGSPPETHEILELVAGEAAEVSGETRPVWIIRCPRVEFLIVPCAALHREATFDDGHELHNLPWRLPKTPPPAASVEITPLPPLPEAKAIIDANSDAAQKVYPKLIEDLPPGSKEPSIEESAQTVAAGLLCGYRPPADNQPGWLTQPERDTVFQGRSKEAAAAVLASATHRAAFQGAGPPAWRYLVARVEARPVQADEAARLEAAQAKLAATSEELLARVGAEFEAQRRKIEETTKPLRDLYKEPTMKAVRQELA